MNLGSKIIFRIKDKEVNNMKPVALKDIPVMATINRKYIGFKNDYSKGWFQKVDYYDKKSYAIFIMNDLCSGNGYHYEVNLDKMKLIDIYDILEESKGRLSWAESSFYSFDSAEELFLWLSNHNPKVENKDEIKKELSPYETWVNNNFCKEKKKDKDKKILLSSLPIVEKQAEF